MPTITTTEWNSITDGGLDRRTQCLIQNIESTAGRYVWFSTEEGAATNGFRISPGGSYEMVTKPDRFYLAASSTADVRVVKL